MKILVTGSAGYIGGTFSFEALKNGHEIIGVDNFSNSNDKVPKILNEYFKDKFIFEEIDLAKEPSKLNALIKNSDPDIAIHFAGLKAVEILKTNQYYIGKIICSVRSIFWLP